MRRVVLIGPLLLGMAVPASAQTSGAFPPGDPAIAPALRQAVRSAEHSYALALPAGANDNNSILQGLLSRGIPSPQDRDLAAQGKVLASKVDAAAGRPVSPCSLFTITAAYGFAAPSSPVILAVSSPCGTAILARSPTGAAAAGTGVAWSPQFGTASFKDFLKGLPAPGSTQ